MRRLLLLAAALALLSSPALAATLATPTATAIGLTPAPTPGLVGMPGAVVAARGDCHFDPPSLASDAFTVADCPAPGAEVGALVLGAIEDWNVAGYTAVAIHQAYIVKKGLARFVLVNTSATTADLDNHIIIHFMVVR